MATVAIVSFQGKYRFLSNFFIEPDGTCVEREYQSVKTLDDVEPLAILHEKNTNLGVNCLFFVSDWPQDLKRDICHTKQGTRAYARIVAKRITRFIESDGLA